MFLIYWALFISNSQELRAGGCLRETVCVKYHFISKNDLLLESLLVGVSKIC